MKKKKKKKMACKQNYPGPGLLTTQNVNLESGPSYQTIMASLDILQQPVNKFVLH